MACQLASQGAWDGHQEGPLGPGRVTELGKACPGGQAVPKRRAAQAEGRRGGKKAGSCRVHIVPGFPHPHPGLPLRLQGWGWEVCWQSRLWVPLPHALRFPRHWAGPGPGAEAGTQSAESTPQSRETLAIGQSGLGMGPRRTVRKGRVPWDSRHKSQPRSVGPLNL